MKRLLLLLVMIIGYCLTSLAQTFTQTRTGTRLNDFDGIYVNTYPKSNAQQVASDDNVYAYSNKLNTQNWYNALVVMGFGFNIPANATIANITVRVKRFKTGSPDIRDYFATLVKSRPGRIEYFETYGLRWYNLANYQATETEAFYTQPGSGNTGNQYNPLYEWTPSLINNPDFGISIHSYIPVGKGTVVVNYDLVEITVEYSLPAARTSLLAAETPLLNQPTVYPNPFTTQTNIQFYANESGRATVELYTVIGTKVKTLFADDIVKGQAYTIEVAEPQLAKGIYLYAIKSGGQNFSGRIIKLE